MEEFIAAATRAASPAVAKRYGEIAQAMHAAAPRPAIMHLDAIPASMVLPYGRAQRLPSTSVHSGQRKLFTALVGTLTRARALLGESYVCVYAGAAPNQYGGLVASMFPGVKLVYVDPNKFLVSQPSEEYASAFGTNSVAIKSLWSNGNFIPADECARLTTEIIESGPGVYLINAYMTDELAEAFRKFGRCAFVSDIRTSVHGGADGAVNGAADAPPDTLDIVWNAAQTYIWCEIMKPAWASFKFRHPFYESEIDVAGADGHPLLESEPYAGTFSRAAKLGIDFVAAARRHHFIFYTGTAYLQAFPGISSTELRLESNCTEHRDYGTPDAADSALFGYNKLGRVLQLFTNPYADRRSGFCCCADCAIVAAVLREYLEGAPGLALSGAAAALHILEELRRITSHGFHENDHGYLYERRPDAVLEAMAERLRSGKPDIIPSYYKLEIAGTVGVMQNTAPKLRPGAKHHNDYALRGADEAPRGPDVAPSKAYDIAFIKAGANYSNLARALEMVREFIVERDRIIYGGMAIDISLRASGAAGIYPLDEVPDYDFMSPDFYADSIELARRLHAAGFSEVNSINGTHVSTRRVRLGSESVADITYVPPAIYSRMRTVSHDGFRVVHPDVQRMDMHRALALLLEKPPREVIQQRAQKDYKRFGLLATAYPIPTVAGPAVELDDTWVLPAGSDYVLGGYVAAAALLGCRLEMGKAGLRVVGRLAGAASKLRAHGMERTPLCIYTDRPYAIAAELKLAEVKYYSRYLDSYYPRAIVGRRGDLVYEIYDNLGTLIPYWTPLVPSSAQDAPSSALKVCTVHQIALYMLLRSFSPPIVWYAGKPKPAAEEEIAVAYRDYYAQLAAALDAHNASSAAHNAGESGKALSASGYNLTLQMYGCRNWPLEYLQTMNVNMEHIAVAPDFSDLDTDPRGQNAPLARPTVKLGWYPERGKDPEPIATASELFLLTDGDLRPRFTAILPQ